MANIMECYRKRFPGSYIYSSSQSVPVYWGHFSIVEAELFCLTDLINSGRNWSYAIDMAGSEVMMSTNKELVTDIRDNMNQIYTLSYPIPEQLKFRIKYKQKYDEKSGWKKLGELDPPPFNITIYKGPKSWRLTRTFVTFLLKHPFAKLFLGEALKYFWWLYNNYNI